MEDFRAHAATASLQQSVANMEDGDGTAGNFMRFAKRTRLTGDDVAAPAGLPDAQVCLPSKSNDRVG